MDDDQHVELSVGAPQLPEVDVASNDGDKGRGFFSFLGGDGAPRSGVDSSMVEPPTVDELQVRTVVILAGGMVGYVLADEDVPEHWDFSAKELDELVPPLTRIINRRPALRSAVMKGDEAAIAVVLGKYAGRNFTTGRAAKRARRIDEEQHGFATEGGSVGGGTPPAPDGSDGSAAGWSGNTGVPGSPG